MKKIINILGLTALIFTLVSCEKHEIKYDAIDVPSDYAQFQFHYFVPIANNAANYISRGEFNDQLFFKDNLAPYNGMPSGAVGKFFAIAKGSVNVKLFKVQKYAIDEYTGPDKYRRDSVFAAGVATHVNVDEKVYEGTFTLGEAKRYNVFITDFAKEPTVLEHPDPYVKGIPQVDTLSYFCFGNFLFDEDGVTPVGTLQLQLRSRVKDTIINPDGSQLIDYTYTNIGNEVAPMTLSPWIWLPVYKARNADGTYVIDSGYETRYFRVMKVKADGTYEDIPYWTSTTAKGTYTDYWSWYVGRRYFWFLGGHAGTRATQIFSGTRWTLL